MQLISALVSLRVSHLPLLIASLSWSHAIFLSLFLLCFKFLIHSVLQSPSIFSLYNPWIGGPLGSIVRHGSSISWWSYLECYRLVSFVCGRFHGYHQMLYCAYSSAICSDKNRVAEICPIAYIFSVLVDVISLTSTQILMGEPDSPFDHRPLAISSR